jgi:hypothetical protein
LFENAKFAIGAPGIVVTTIELGVLFPQTFSAVTETVPPLASAVNIMELVVLAPVHVDGKDQLYTTFGSFTTLYVLVVLAQTAFGPVIAVGAGAGETTEM